jgi:hypothetical protein
MECIEELKAVLETGASVAIKSCTVDDAIDLARAAKRGGGNLTIKGSYQYESMHQIAAAGGKHVTFDLTS